MQFFRLLCIDDYIMLLFEFLFREIMLSQLNRDIYFLHKIKTEKSEKKYLHLSFKWQYIHLFSVQRKNSRKHEVLDLDTYVPGVIFSIKKP